jgi:hypothetical protein
VGWGYGLCVGAMRGIMNLADLFYIIMTYGSKVPDEKCFVINGCKVLEHVEDVDGFVSLLGRFARMSIDNIMIGFLKDHPNPIESMLNGDVRFNLSCHSSMFEVCILGEFDIWHFIGNHCYHYEEMTTLDTSWWLRGDNLDND